MQDNQPRYFFDAYIDRINIAIMNPNLTVPDIVDWVLCDDLFFFEGEFIPYYEFLEPEWNDYYEKFVKGEFFMDEYYHSAVLWVPHARFKSVMPYMLSIELPNIKMLRYLGNLLVQSNTKASLSMFDFFFGIYPRQEDEFWDGMKSYLWFRDNVWLKDENEELSDRDGYFKLFSTTDRAIEKLVLYLGEIEDEKGLGTGRNFVRLGYSHIRLLNKKNKIISPTSLNEAYFKNLIGKYVRFKDTKFNDDFHRNLKNVSII